jgi:hypothetical protein
MGSVPCGGVLVVSTRSGHTPGDGVRGGHAETDQSVERATGVLAICLQKHFEFRPDWHRAGEVRGLVAAYYTLLRPALRAKPQLRHCLKRCRHCGIFFPTHPRNAERRDLRCPFGCRQGHGKRRSTKRSVEYYQTKEGRVKRRMHNGKRKRRQNAAQVPKRPEQGEALESAQAVGYDAAMVEHVRMTTSLLEGRKVSRREILEMLARAEKKQHSIGGSEKTEYRARDLNENSS